MSRPTDRPPSQRGLLYGGSIIPRHVALDPRDQRDPSDDEAAAWAAWERHLDAGRIGGKGGAEED